MNAIYISSCTRNCVDEHHHEAWPAASVLASGRCANDFHAAKVRPQRFRHYHAPIL